MNIDNLRPVTDSSEKPEMVLIGIITYLCIAIGATGFLCYYMKSLSDVSAYASATPIWSRASRATNPSDVWWIGAYLYFRLWLGALIGFTIGLKRKRAMTGLSLGAFLGPIIGTAICFLLRPLGRSCPYCHGDVVNIASRKCLHCLQEFKMSNAEDEIIEVCRGNEDAWFSAWIPVLITCVATGCVAFNYCPEFGWSLLSAYLFSLIIGIVIAVKKENHLAVLIAMAFAPVGFGWVPALFVSARKPICPYCGEILPDRNVIICMHCGKRIHCVEKQLKDDDLVTDDAREK